MFTIFSTRGRLKAAQRHEILKLSETVASIHRRSKILSRSYVQYLYKCTRTNGTALYCYIKSVKLSIHMYTYGKTDTNIQFGKIACLSTIKWMRLLYNHPQLSRSLASCFPSNSESLTVCTTSPNDLLYCAHPGSWDSRDIGFKTGPL